jgi:hypothetical protein
VLRDFVTQSKLLSGMLYDLHKMDDLNNCRVQTQYCKIFCTIVGFVPKLSNTPSHSHDTCVRWFDVSGDLHEDIFLILWWVMSQDRWPYDSRVL